MRYSLSDCRFERGHNIKQRTVIAGSGHITICSRHVRSHLTDSTLSCLHLLDSNRRLFYRGKRYDTPAQLRPQIHNRFYLVAATHFSEENEVGQTKRGSFNNQNRIPYIGFQ